MGLTAVASRAAALIWSSDQVGAFGEGESFDATLPIGTHLITLTATDSDGNTGSAGVTVVVQYDEPQASGGIVEAAPPEVPAPTPTSGARPAADTASPQ